MSRHACFACVEDRNSASCSTDCPGQDGPPKPEVSESKTFMELYFTKNGTKMMVHNSEKQF